ESLADAMEGYPKIFPELMVTMIKAGELGGVLDEVLNRLAVQFEREYKFREKIKNVMTYPSFVGMVTVVVVFFLLVWVIPMFSYVFINMDLDLPLPTRILLDLGVLLKKYWYLIIIFNLAIIVGLKKYINSEKGRYGKDKLLLFIPIIGDIITKVNIARFSQTLSTLLSGGIPILQALAAVEKTVENKVISDSITVARVGVSQGVGLAKSLAVSGFFPPMVIEMIAIGEESGALDSMLSKVADFYETETEFTLNRITSIIEPLMIIFMSMIVGGIAAAILLPMFDLINLGW
ncbi:MAG TPA: type II secretion system F family protein, partial [Clostridia bacterium]|nr:type II secretion system F family protein [Clostridia bacterium]